MNLEEWAHFSFIYDEDKEYKTADLCCPHCDKRPVVVLKNSVHNVRDEASIEAYEEQRRRPSAFEYEADIDLTNDWGKFSLWMTCQTCSEHIHCFGKYFGRLTHEPVEPFGERDVYYYEYIPEFVEPGFKIIDIPNKTPDDVRANLLLSFSLFHYNLEACANKLRIAIERLMDSENIPTTDGNGERISLDARIGQFNINGKKFKKEKIFLSAVKWIGNEGSHRETTKDGVLDAYMFLEDFLETIYVDSASLKRKKAIQIIQNKGSS